MTDKSRVHSAVSTHSQSAVKVGDSEFDGDPKIRKLKLVHGMLPNQVGWKKYNDGSKNYSCPPGDPRIKKLKLVPGLLKKGD